MTSPDTAIVKTEVFSIDALTHLMQCDGVSTIDKNRLRKYKDSASKGNEVRVSYLRGKKLKTEEFGRVTPEKGIGLASFPREIRNFLAKKYYFDLDIVNAQPTLLEQICKTKGWSCDKLSTFNANRESLMKELDSDRKQAKIIVMRMLFGTPNPNEFTGFFAELVEQLAVITTNLSNDAPAELKKIAKKHTTYNEKGSICACFLQQEEFKCLVALDTALTKEGRYLATLINDGGFVRKLDGEVGLSSELIEKCQAHISKDTGYAVQLKQKELDTTFELPDVRDEYQEMKIEFEKNHFKLNDPVAYVRVYAKDVKVLSRTDLMNLYENTFYNGTESFIKKWLTDPTMRTYEQLVYKPMQEVESKYFNLFQGYDCDAVEGNISVVHEVLNLVCNNEKPVFEYVEKYMAHLLQRPYDKAGISIIVQSNAEGTGKDSYFDLIGRILGGQYFLNTASAADSVFSKFNGHWKKALMIKMEELSFMETKAHADKFKTFITADRICFEDKGQKSITIDNYTRFIGTTNNAVPVIIGTNDRRFVLIRASEARVGDKAYWDKTQKDLHSDATRKAYFHYLMNLDISQFNVRDRPITEYYEEVKESFIPYHAQFFQKKVQSMPEDSELSWSANDLIEEMKISTSSKFELNQTRIGRDLRLYVKDEILQKHRNKHNIRYVAKCDDVRKYLENKDWWYEL
jgi:hypothetical protein